MHSKKITVNFGRQVPQVQYPIHAHRSVKYWQSLRIYLVWTVTNWFLWTQYKSCISLKLIMKVWNASHYIYTLIISFQMTKIMGQTLAVTKCKFSKVSIYVLFGVVPITWTVVCHNSCTQKLIILNLKILVINTKITKCNC